MWHFKIPTRTKATRPAIGEMYAYVQGYILALEDVLGDVAKYRERVIKERSITDPNQATFGIQDMIRKTLEQAHDTLAALEQLEDETPTSWKQFSGGLEPENQPTKE